MGHSDWHQLLNVVHNTRWVVVPVVKLQFRSNYTSAILLII